MEISFSEGSGHGTPDLTAKLPWVISGGSQEKLENLTVDSSQKFFGDQVWSRRFSEKK
jgi:hypothetical protein